MTGAGHLKTRIKVERRAAQAGDAYGRVRTDWSGVTDLASEPAGFRPVYGREGQAAGRTAATLAGTVTVRLHPATLTILAEDRITFLDGPDAGTVLGITARPVRTPDGAWIELPVETGKD